MSTVLVTGAAGFIGMHTARQLLARGHRVLGIDNLNDYYDPALKRARIAAVEQAAPQGQFRFTVGDIADEAAVQAAVGGEALDGIVHLAAQAGVRYSLKNPMAYARSNLVGMTVMLELARHAQVKHLVYASSSSVYGGNQKVPFAESDRVDQPVSFYAATKRANEAMAYSYSHLYGVPCTGLRFFTVYGPWGRPDMAAWLFTDAILAGRPIDVFAGGHLQRDFTFIDDIVEGVVRVLEAPPQPQGGAAAHALYNIGHHSPVTVNDFIATLEKLTDRTAQRRELPMQPGDVERTYADIDALRAAVGFAPRTSLADGLRLFVDWFRAYHGR
jgi:UDP-glucuronate 4-epimerase